MPLVKSKAAKSKLAVAAAALALLGCSQLKEMTSTAPARTENGIFLGAAGPHAVQPLADKPRFGKPISEADVVAWNIDVRSTDGLGLPAGRGSVKDGQPATLMSRAVDSTGYVQPTVADLRKVSAIVGFVQHHNGIQPWAVNASGEVRNVIGQA